MARMPWPAAMPREISSRSTKLSTLGERRLMGGEIPPLDPSPRRTAELPRSSALPMPKIDSPALYMRQSSAHWESVNNRRRPPLMHHPLFVRLQPGCFADRLRPPTLLERMDFPAVRAPEFPDRTYSVLLAEFFGRSGEKRMAIILISPLRVASETRETRGQTGRFRFARTLK